ncbi:MAG: hypothetical protein K0S38_522 [Candidatus Paceibacter sp.]|jgi:diadenosine tetraphosphate (Ap4A) HIT family hydrolase|nr:hypothetical protein [Candidatus Paceibacter sp.]
MMDKLIFDTEYWNVFLSDDQTYLGRIAVELKRVSPTLSDLTNEEFADLHNVIKQYEAAATKAFGAKMFNWTCLMNDAYKRTPPNPHVHWHARPRYDKPVEFVGETFVDPNFGEHYIRGTKREVSKVIQNKIIEALR